jgi:hypothetical protein
MHPTDPPAHENNNTKYGIIVKSLAVADKLVISPTHKRTKRRAPVWGSYFTSKDTTPQEDSAEIAPALYVELWDMVVVASYHFLAKSYFRIYLNLRD